jgi:mannan endo-1,4-beta-mannosidase
LVWRNANNETDRKEHFYAPYKGHASENDFIQFTKDPLILLESGLPNMYQRKN